ncbi:hypothetical protein [Clostridium algidicarnis]|uniref:hypothetical protein n=1 Tax=Clostridium algidicarnis TaxID=37659 RepID=UPI001C0DD9F0|nr:hypothetical protein [Clostridium algidicarnis]MBU3228628.1 hypothetical protein [Clostridium algidicarnis]MBU3251326.1 hypothetical protein [Clostridium algidicarnis]
MSMYGDRHVKIHDLKEWVKYLSIDEIKSINIAGKDITIDELSKEILELQIEMFKKAVNNLEDGDDWRNLQEIFSPLFYNAFFKVGNNSIRIANYYECLVVSSDIETKKKIIKGFDYLDIGAINLYNGDKAFGCIGMKSDLIWSVLYDYFIFHDESGAIIHTMPCHEELMSIQLIDINYLSIKEIEHRVKEILLKCSIELGLNFKVVKLDKKLRDIGIDTVYNLNIQENKYESEPLMYFDNGIATEDIRMKYLSYYQVLEYFFNRTQNYKLLDEIKIGNYIGESSINHTELKKMLKKYVNSLSEKESLKLVLARAVDITRVKDWINSDSKRIEQYCNCSEPRINIDLTKSDEKVIGKLAEQIYYYRCAIAHAKGDTEEYLAIPEQSDDIIKKEIPLLKLIAEKVLKKCSEF